MNKIRNIEKKIYKRNDFWLIVGTIVYLIISLCTTLEVDDSILSKKYAKIPFSKEFSLIKHDYLYWSSRVIVNFFVHIFIRSGLKVWAIFNSLFIFIFLKTLSKLFIENNERKNNLILFLVFMLYPFTHMCDAGWITTTITYLWVMICGTVSFIPIKKILNDEKINKYEYILYSLALIFSANQEQMAVCLLFVYIFFVIYLLIKKKFNWYVIFELILVIFSLIFIFSVPGNGVRAAKEIVRNGGKICSFLDYNRVSFIDKVDMGFSSALYQLTFHVENLTLILCIVLYFAIFKKYKDVVYRIIGATPTFIILMNYVLKSLFGYNCFLVRGISNYGSISVINYLNISSYGQLFVMLLFVITLILSIYLVFENTFDSVFCIFIFLVGLASRVGTAFSPTVWGAGDRTLIFLYFSILIIILKVVLKLLNKNEISEKQYKLGIFIIIICDLISFGFLLMNIVIDLIYK